MITTEEYDALWLYLYGLFPRQPRDHLTPDAWAALIDSAGYEFEEIKAALDVIAEAQAWVALSDIVAAVKRQRARAGARARAAELTASPLGQVVRQQDDPRPLREQITELMDREWPGRPAEYQHDPATRQELRLRGLARRQVADARAEAQPFDERLDAALGGYQPGPRAGEPAYRPDEPLTTPYDVGADNAQREGEHDDQ